MLWPIFLVLLLFGNSSFCLDTNFVKTLQQAEDTVTVAINDIADAWQIDKFPNFLRSTGLSRADWESLVQRFKRKIVNAATSVSPAEKFIISFMGSSVTAGHDSHFNLSFPVLVGKKMTPVLASLGVQVVSRNVAMGNNPCMPYDLCVRTFAGEDADVVHWEQTYNCAHGDNLRVLEQFVRQAASMPSRPIIVFADSETPNWRKADCPRNSSGHLTSLPPLAPEEVAYLEVYHLSPSGVSAVATDSKLNAKSIFRRFGYLKHIMKKYKKVVAVQLWDHSLYQRYKCHGPYVPDWQGHNAKWHPSLLGHRLRADHHSFFWLAAWRDAIISLRGDMALESSMPLLPALTAPPALPLPLVESGLTDGLQCFTNYEPRSMRGSSLHSLVVAGRAPADVAGSSSGGSFSLSGGWRTEVYESLASKKIVPMANKAGYLDYKVVMFGDQAAGPLSLLLSPQAEGHVFLCEAPGIWGKMLAGFAPLHNASLILFVTELVNNAGEVSSVSQFQFSPERAVQVRYSHSRVDDLCLEVLHPLRLGRSSILTIVPKGMKKVTLATVLVP